MYDVIRKQRLLLLTLTREGLKFAPAHPNVQFLTVTEAKMFADNILTEA